MEKVANGWVLQNANETWICDTLSEAVEQINAEEEKFPVGGE